MPKDIKKRFMEKVEKTDSCWLWKAQIYPSGYGSFWMNGKNVTAHRASWKIFNGIFYPTLNVCHKCDVRNCVNPDHLWLGNDKENALDKIEKGRQQIQNCLLEHYPDILEKYMNGVTCKDLSIEYKVHIRTIFKIIRIQIPRIPGYFRKNNKQLKLNPDDIFFIRKNYKKGKHGFGFLGLAKKLSVSKNVVRDVLQGKTWRTV